MRTRLLWSAAVLSLASALTLALVCQGPPRVRVGSDWTPARLHEEMVKAGEPWEAHPVHAGLVLRRPGTWPDWQQLIDASRDYAHFHERRDCLHLEHTGMSVHGGSVPRGMIQLQRIVIRGHPDDLQRVLELFTP